MAKSASTSSTATKKTPRKAAPATKPPAIDAVTDKSGAELVIENFAAVSHLAETLGETMELLVQKTENMAYHIIAIEEILSELVASNGLNLARVNSRIRNTIASGTDNLCDPSNAIDIAASIASPSPRR